MRYATHYAVHWGNQYVFCCCFKCTYNIFNSVSNRICIVSYRLGGAHISLWVHGSCCVSHHPFGSLPLRVALVRAYSAHREPDPPPPTNPTPTGGKGGPEVVKERALAVLKVLTFPLSSTCIFLCGSQMFLFVNFLDMDLRSILLSPACRGARAAVGSEVCAGSKCLCELLVGEIRRVCRTE